MSAVLDNSKDVGLKSDDLKLRLIERFPDSKLQLATASSVASLEALYPDIPDDYVRFLLEVGYGSIGQCRFMIYSGPVKPRDIYDEETAESLKGLLLIGDDFSGYCVGYATESGWTIGEVNQNGVFRPLRNISSFSKFVENRFLKS